MCLDRGKGASHYASSVIDGAPSDLDTARLGLLVAALNGDVALAYEIVTAQMEIGMDVGSILFDLMSPLQRDVGHRWQTGDYRIADEHAATATLETVVAMLGGALAIPLHGDHLVVVAAEGDTHSLPARMIATYLVYLGRRVTNLGATIPATDLIGHLVDSDASALLVTCSISAAMRGARLTIGAGHAAGIPVIAGGRAFGVDDRRAMALGADAWLADPRELEHLLDTWSPSITDAEARFAPVDPLDVRYPHLAEDLTAAVPALGRAEARRIISVLDGAALTGDMRIVDELLDWYRLHRHGETTVDSHALSTGLLAVIPAGDPLRAAIGAAL